VPGPLGLTTVSTVRSSTNALGGFRNG
jgi:hypothetical protein